MKDKKKSKKKPWQPTRLPKWKILGFNSEQEMRDFENRPDFPGWEYL